jgi:hypothetical protein
MREKKYKSYKAILWGKDNFQKEMIIKYPLPQIFIPKIENCGCYLGEPLLLDRPVSEHRIFLLEKDKCWKDKLIYKEINP